jgi:hypothetical protein
MVLGRISPEYDTCQFRTPTFYSFGERIGHAPERCRWRETQLFPEKRAFAFKK